MNIPRQVTLILLFNLGYCCAMTPHLNVNQAKQLAVQNILNSRGDINQRLDRFGNQRAILLLADDDENNELLQKVLTRRPIIGTKDYIQATVLHRAARNNAIKNLIALLEYSKNLRGFASNSFVNACTILKKTALHEAVENGNPCCAKVLLRYGATVNNVTNKGLTEGHLVFKEKIYGLPDPQFDKRLELLAILYCYGANFNATTKQGKNVLGLANHEKTPTTAEINKKNATLALLESFKKLSVLNAERSNTHSFCSVVPADIVWMVGNFIVGRELPRK